MNNDETEAAKDAEILIEALGNQGWYA